MSWLLLSKMVAYLTLGSWRSGSLAGEDLGSRTMRPGDSCYSVETLYLRP
jgi:hypothetical protein